MIRVSKLIGRSDSSPALRLAVSEIAGVTIPVRQLERSIAFYSRVFGLAVSRSAGPLSRRVATLAGPGEALVALREQHNGASGPLPLQGRWGFLVDDLDRARETAWDLGVKVAEDNGEPDHIRRWANGRSLSVRDPDGNAIELIEEVPERASQLRRRHCPARAAWRRWVRHAACPAR
jgi:catechol 2,3-dioxygenase-like lactoylglutathione lyase family enzyme